MARQIERDDAVLACEQRRDVVPPARVRGAAVDEHEAGPRGRTPTPVVDRDAVALGLGVLRQCGEHVEEPLRRVPTVGSAGLGVECARHALHRVDLLVDDVEHDVLRGPHPVHRGRRSDRPANPKLLRPRAHEPVRGRRVEDALQRHRQRRRAPPGAPTPRSMPVRSWRAGLPVIDRDRTVSPKPAASRFSITHGSVSRLRDGRARSSRSTRPARRAPSPRPSGARGRCRRRRARARPDRRVSTTSGTSTIVEISPQWPPASVPWAMSTSTPSSTLRSRVPRAARRARRRARPSRARLSTAYAGGGPSAFTSIETGWRSVASTWPGPSTSTPRPAAFITPSTPSGSGGTSYSASTCSTKSRCSAGISPRASSKSNSSPLPTNFSGIAKSTPYGLPSMFSSIQRQLDLELVGAERERAEHAVAAGLAHRGDDVAAVREGEERELDAELVTDGGAHVSSEVGVRARRWYGTPSIRAALSADVPRSPTR